MFAYDVLQTLLLSGITAIAVAVSYIELEPFYGDVDTFSDLCEDHLTNVYNNKYIPVSQKMSYHRNSVHGEVKKMIAGFPKTADAYEMAWNLIQERYGRPERVVPPI